MALVGDPIRLGLDVIRLKLGENAYRFVMRFARKNKIDPITSKKLDTVGSLCGLNSSEIEEASTGSNETTEYPMWIRVVFGILALIVISGSIILWRNATYLPGTLYASLSPNDFSRSS